jgi:hypothetical protein
VSTFTAFLRANPAVAAILAASVIVAIVFGTLAILMTRAGVSLRPLAFLAGFFAIVGGPQVAFHVAQALGVIPKKNLTWTFGKDRVPAGYDEQDALLAADDGRFRDPDAVFGPGIDRDLVTDLRRAGAESPFGDAEVAQMAVIPPTSSAVVARYRDAASASAAQGKYVAMAAGFSPPTGSDGAITFTRPQGDVVKVLTAGRTLIALSGPDEPSVDSRLRSSRVVTRREAGFMTPLDPTASEFWLYRPSVLASIVVVLLIIATLFFFKGSAWAATVRARDGVPVQPATELRERLLGTNTIDAPFTVAEREDGKVMVTWRFADAKWVDLARAHGMRNTHRIILELDEASKTVYPTEQYTRMDWSAGAGGGSFRWATGMGITFFQVEHQRVFGLQLDERGRFVPNLSYSYRFNLQEMKAPLISAVTNAGWQWRPTIWQGPTWLRWLTH